jgi:hypothetical protein
MLCGEMQKCVEDLCETPRRLGQRRRSYRNVSDTKSGKRSEMSARLSFDTAYELGFRGGLDEWERLMGAVARR